MSKCAECGAPAKAYCVETDKAYCPNCVGRLFIPKLKQTSEFNLEAIDSKHAWVVQVLKYVMYTTATLGFLLAFWRYDVSSEYFSGGAVCPGVSAFRKALARFDANVFYYYKPSLSTSCDIEDSYWRLLIDGWVRGLATGSDSLILLASTLPMAWLFKIAAGKFLRPVYGSIYALLGMTLSTVITEAANGQHWVNSQLPDWVSVYTGKLKSSRIFSGVQVFTALPVSLKTNLTTKWLLFDRARSLFLCLAVAGMVRLSVHHIGLSALAGYPRGQGTSILELAGEPLCFWILASLCTKANAYFSKKLWKKVVLPPLRTQRRIKPAKDILDKINYTRSRQTRMWNHYWGQADDVLNFFIDYVFYATVIFRVLCIVFPIAPVLRQALRCVGLGTKLDAQREWFFSETGFKSADGGDVGASYLTDSLAKVALWSASVVTDKEASVVLPQNYEEQVAFLHQAAWLVGVPALCLLLDRKVQGMLKSQQTAFKEEWEGKAWKTGKYTEMLDEFGSYWVKVPKEEWLKSDL